MNKTFLHLNATKQVAFLLFIFLSGFYLVSQSPPPQEKSEITITENSTLPDLLEAAALNNPGLRAAFERWQSALQQVPQVKALPNPQLTFAYFIRSIETRVGPQRSRIGLMQMFPWFGKLKLKGSAALLAANAAEQNAENMKLKLYYQVKEAYYDYYYIARTADLLKENIQLLKQQEKVMEIKYTTGTASYTNLVKIQVEADKLQDRLNSTIDLLVPVKAKLNTILNRPPNALLPIPRELPAETEEETIDLPDDRLLEQMKKNNPGLKALDAAAAKEQTAINLAKKDYYPDFSIGVDYILTGAARMPGVMDSGKDPIAAMVSLQLPLWAKKNRAAVADANARYRAAIQQRQEEENNLAARLEMVLFQYRDAQRKIVLYRDNLIPRTRQALEVTRSAFESGNAGYLDFIDTQRTLLEFELALAEAKTRRAQRLAEIQALTAVGAPPTKENE